MTAVTVECDEKSAGIKTATGRTSLLPRKARPNDVGCSSGPLRLSLRAGFLEKREKGRTPSYFVSTLEDFLFVRAKKLASRTRHNIPHGHEH